MNTDIRLSVEFWDHHKTVKLERRGGLEAVKGLLVLWAWVAKNRPDGNLSDLDDEAIEIHARWQGDAGQLVQMLAELRWIDGEGGARHVHDWADHNSWAAESSQRSDEARLLRMAHTHPEIYNATIASGQRSVTRAEYLKLTQRQRHVNDTCNGPLTPAPAPAPAPAPSPAPAPNPKKERKEKSGENAAAQFHFVLKDGTQWTMPTDKQAEYAKAYPELNVEIEFRKARQWCIDNPDKRKTSKGITAFITNWLNKALDNATPKPHVRTEAERLRMTEAEYDAWVAQEERWEKDGTAENYREFMRQEAIKNGTGAWIDGVFTEIKPKAVQP